MNQKEYELIAEQIKYEIASWRAMDDTQAIKALEILTKRLTFAFSINYPKTFDATKFLAACGVAQ